MTHDDTLYLQHILDATRQIAEYLDGVSEDEFYRTPLLQDGVIRQLEIIGEATRRLSMSWRERYDHVPWQDIVGMRNKLIHDYFGVDLSTVWVTATRDVPVLQKWVRHILEDFKNEGSVQEQESGPDRRR